MKDWLTKYSIPLCALFVTCLSVYLNLQNWKRQGTNLIGTAANISVTFVLWALLVIAIFMFLSRQKKLAEKSRQCQITVREVAGLLRVPNSWVYERTRRRTRDRIPGFRIGKYWRFRLGDIKAWIEENRHGGTAAA